MCGVRSAQVHKNCTNTCIVPAQSWNFLFILLTGMYFVRGHGTTDTDTVLKHKNLQVFTETRVSNSNNNNNPKFSKIPSNSGVSIS